MVISRSMNIKELQALMAGTFTEADARRFRDILVEAGYSGVDTSYAINSDRWHALLDKLDSPA